MIKTRKNMFSPSGKFAVRPKKKETKKMHGKA